MEHYNKISTELEQLGFKKENDLFIYDNITYNNIIVNGQQYQQPQHNYIYLQYVGEGYIKDSIDPDDECSDSDSDYHSDENIQEISQFDLLNERKELVITICVSDINDIKLFLGI